MTTTDKKPVVGECWKLRRVVIHVDSVSHGWIYVRRAKGGQMDAIKIHPRDWDRCIAKAKRATNLEWQAEIKAVPA